MAKRQERQEYTNPEVRFERADIEYRAVVYFGIVLSVSILLVIFTMTWYGYILMKQPDKKSTMPIAKADKEKSAPPIALEALEDIRDREAGKPRGPMLFPPRAAEYYASQKKLLEEGGKGVLSMEKTFKALAEKQLLPSRKGRDAAAPTSFSARLPSKAAAGRVDTGGQ